jgi:flagellar motility protein MotE (MotC chaperone)
MIRPKRLPSLAPRLLPLTVFCLGCLLALKSVSLVRAAAPAATTTATPQATPASPAPHAPTPAPTPAPAATPADQPSGPPPISDSERAVLLELRQRRQELEAREQTIAAREALLAAAERKISARVDELRGLQTRLEALDTTRRERDEASWRGLVKVYETMKPREAAAIMNDLDMPVLLGVLDRMKEAKAAPILAAMQPDKARQVTAELAQMRQRANSLGRAGG